jgi:ubiquinone/menaquinone biosynthesis C-methylase UbiE
MKTTNNNPEKTEMDYIDIIGGTFEDSGPRSNQKYNRYDKRARERVISKLLPREGRGVLLDLGCSIGAWRDFFVRKGYKKIVGVDISPERLSLAAKRGYTAVCARGETLPFKDCSFSTIVSIDMLVHVLRERDRAKVFAEVFRVLQPNGIFIFSISSRKEFALQQMVDFPVNTLLTWVLRTFLRKSVKMPTKTSTKNAIVEYCVFLNIGDIESYLAESWKSYYSEARSCQFIYPSFLVNFPPILSILDFLLGGSFCKEYGKVIFVKVRKGKS